MSSAILSKGKKVIFHLPSSLVLELEQIPRGQRSRFVSRTLEKEFRIKRRNIALGKFVDSHEKIDISISKQGWGDVKYGI